MEVNLAESGVTIKFCTINNLAKRKKAKTLKQCQY